MTTNKALKILLVEDEPIAMMANSGLLALLGYTPDTAINGEETLKLVDKQYDVIFMDIGLPDINGIEVSEKIRQRENQKKPACIIALTAYIQDETLKEKCLAVGINEIVGKPISADSLKTLINKYTNKKLMSN